MSKYIPFTDEQKQRANSVDLVDFLRAQGEKVTRAGHDFRWVRHDSVTVCGNRWFQHSESNRRWRSVSTTIRRGSKLPNGSRKY